MRFSRIRTLGLVVLAFAATALITSCSNSTSPQNKGQVETPQKVDLTQKVPQNLQNNSPQAYQYVASVQAEVSMGEDIYPQIQGGVSDHGGSFSSTYQGLTVTYSATPQTQDGVAGTAWSVTYDGTFTVDDTTTITFNNDKVFSGWTSNDGNSGNFDYNFGVFSQVYGESSGSVNIYHVEWNTDSSGTITVQTTLNYDQYSSEATLIINDDGSGSYTATSNGDQTNLSWDADGNVTS